LRVNREQKSAYQECKIENDEEGSSAARLASRATESVGVEAIPQRVPRAASSSSSASAVVPDTAAEDSELAADTASNTRARADGCPAAATSTGARA